jgi:hypothetical protein
MMRERVTEAKFIVRVSKKELESIAYKFVVMEKTLKRILDEEHGMHHTGCCFFQSRYGQTKGERCDCAMKDVKAALLFDPVKRDGDHPKNMKEILEESMKIGSEVWKDVPDAAEHIRKKRGPLPSLDHD